MEYFPLFLRLAGRAVVVIGGGPVAARKVTLLLAAEARVTVIAPVLCTEIERLRHDGRLDTVISDFVPELLTTRFAGGSSRPRLVVAATADAAVNHAVAALADRHGVPVNVVDDLAASTALVPAIVDRDPVLVACSTGGSSPVLATELRATLETVLPPRLGALATFARRHRATVKARIPDLDARRKFWLGALRGNIAIALLAGDEPRATAALAAALDAPDSPPDTHCAIVLATAADPDRLTLGAVRTLFATSHLLHDSGISDAVLALSRRDVGRTPLAPTAPTDFVAERSAAVLNALAATTPVAYLTTADAALAAQLATALSARGVLTQVW